MTLKFVRDFRFTEAAVRLLPPGQTSVTVPALDSVDATALVALHIGDKLRVSDIPNCPWFVVSSRYWELGTTTTLTIWLDVPED